MEWKNHWSYIKNNKLSEIKQYILVPTKSIKLSTTGEVRKTIYV